MEIVCGAQCFLVIAFLLSGVHCADNCHCPAPRTFCLCEYNCTSIKCGSPFTKSSLDASALRQIENSLPPSVSYVGINNYIDEELPPMFLDGKEVRYVSIQNSAVNGLLRIGENAIGAQGVGKMQLVNNRNLRTVHPRAFSRLFTLGYLEIEDHPSLVSADFDFSNNPRIFSFKVEKSNISHMNRPILHKDVSPRDLGIHIYDSPLVCDCNMQWLSENWSNSSIVECFEPKMDFYWYTAPKKEMFTCPVWQPPTVPGQSAIAQVCAALLSATLMLSLFHLVA